MQTVYLNGGIAKFGERWEVYCRTIPEIFKLIECQTPGFRNYLIEAVESGIGFEIQRGEEFVDEDTLMLSLGEEDIIITEVPAGAKSGGAKILAAVAIAAVVIMNPALFAGTAQLSGAAIGQSGTVAVSTGLNTAGLVAASVATSLAISGLTQLLAPGPEVDSAETNESYLFNGPVNTTKQGLPVPVAYGELIVGGAAISAAYSTNRQAFSPISNRGPSFSDPRASEDLIASNTSGGGSYIECFIGDALVTMSDGTQKRIQDIVPGDEVAGHKGINTVLENNAKLTEARLYSINEYPYFVTDTHPFLTSEGWKSFNAVATQEIHPELEVTQLEKGDILITEKGTEILEKVSKAYKTIPVFNLNVDGDDTYIVNRFIVHNK